MLGWCSDSMSFHQMVLFILHLNFSINNYPSCLLSLTVLLNLYNSSIVFSSCSSIFSSMTLTVLFISSYQNLFFKSAKNSFTISYSRFSNSKSFNIFSFYTSTDLLCIYNNIYLICFSTISPFIFILINNLYASKTLRSFLLFYQILMS